MAGTPYRTNDIVDVTIGQEFAVELLGEIDRPISKRTVYPILIGGFDGGSWQVERVATRRDDAGFDDIVATFRRVLV